MNVGSRRGESCLTIYGRSTYSYWTKKVFVEGFGFFLEVQIKNSIRLSLGHQNQQNVHFWLWVLKIIKTNNQQGSNS